MHKIKSTIRRNRMFLLPLLASALSLSPLSSFSAGTPASFEMFANSATSGPDLLHLLTVAGTTGTLVQNYNVSSGNGRGVVVVDNIIYSTESGPSGNIFGGSNIIYKTDRTTGASLGTITVSGLPAGAAMSTLAWDGTHFWTTEYLGGNHAYRIDTSGTIVKTITLSLASSNMDGLEFFNDKLICNRGDSVGPYDIYDLDGNVIQAAFINRTSGTGIAFDGTNFYTSNFSSLSVWDGTTGAYLNDIALSGGSFLIVHLSVDYATRPDTGNQPGPISPYYLTAGQQGVTTIAQVDAIISSFTNHILQSPGQYAISVLNTVRLLGGFFEGSTTVGSEYTLEGVYTGKDYPFPIVGAGFWDGATDGTSNYSVDYEKGGVYKFNSNWAYPSLLFSTPAHYLGITFDESNNTIWISQWDAGVVEHRALNGNLLSSFNVPFTRITSLALDPADQTLWMGSQGTLGTFYQYNQTGTQVRTRDYPSLVDKNTLGGEFPSAFVNPSPPPAPGPIPTVSVSASPGQISEGGNADFIVSRSIVSSQPLLVSFVMGGIALEGSDYTLSASSGRVTIPAGATSVRVTLRALFDQLNERTEGATIILALNPPYKLSRTKSATINIRNAPPPPPSALSH